jgi:hypothetical protein
MAVSYRICLRISGFFISFDVTQFMEKWGEWAIYAIKPLTSLNSVNPDLSKGGFFDGKKRID